MNTLTFEPASVTFQAVGTLLLALMPLHVAEARSARRKSQIA